VQKLKSAPKDFTLGAIVSFTREFLPNFSPENMIWTYTKDFSLEKE
jgi:hypothetical protein